MVMIIVLVFASMVMNAQVAWKMIPIKGGVSQYVDRASSKYKRIESIDRQGRLYKSTRYGYYVKLDELEFAYNEFGDRKYRIERTFNKDGTVKESTSVYEYKYDDNKNIVYQKFTHWSGTISTYELKQNFGDSIFTYAITSEGKTNDYIFKLDSSRNVYWEKFFSKKADNFQIRNSSFYENGYYKQRTTYDLEGNLVKEYKQELKYDRKGQPKKLWIVEDGKKRLVRKFQCYKYYE